MCSCVHAMQHGCRSGSCSSMSPSTSLTDSLVDSGYAAEGSGLGNFRRSGVPDPSLPRVHSTGRANNGLSTKVSHPEVIYNHTDPQRSLSTLSNESSESTLFTQKIAFIPKDDYISSDSSLNRKNSAPKLNVPGTSVVVHDGEPVLSVERNPLPVVTADKLTRYPLDRKSVG